MISTVLSFDFFLSLRSCCPLEGWRGLSQDRVHECHRAVTALVVKPYTFSAQYTSKHFSYQEMSRSKHNWILNSH